MIWWPVLESIYFALGGFVAVLTAQGHAERLRAHAAGFDVLAAFIVVFGTIWAWPVIWALAAQRDD